VRCTDPPDLFVLFGVAVAAVSSSGLHHQLHLDLQASAGSNRRHRSQAALNGGN
jgi:type II secretory pathway component PulK